MMNDIMSLKEKRNKLIDAACERLQSIKDNADTVNEFDMAGIQQPLSMLEETHKRLMASVETLNDVSSAAGKPSVNVRHAVFRYHGIS